MPDFTKKAAKIIASKITLERLAADLCSIHKAGQRRMRARARDACEGYKARMEAAAIKREAEGKPNTVALCKADAGNSLAETVRRLPIE